MKHFGLQHFLTLEVQILVNLIILEILSKFKDLKIFEAHFNFLIFLRKKKRKGKEGGRKERKEGGRKEEGKKGGKKEEINTIELQKIRILDELME